MRCQSASPVVPGVNFRQPVTLPAPCSTGTCSPGGELALHGASRCLIQGLSCVVAHSWSSLCRRTLERYGQYDLVPADPQEAFHPSIEPTNQRGEMVIIRHSPSSSEAGASFARFLDLTNLCVRSSEH